MESCLKNHRLLLQNVRFWLKSFEAEGPQDGVAHVIIVLSSTALRNNYSPEQRTWKFRTAGSKVWVPVSDIRIFFSKLLPLYVENILDIKTLIVSDMEDLNRNSC